jgi:hypothetical protein
MTERLVEMDIGLTSRFILLYVTDVNIFGEEWQN